MRSRPTSARDLLDGHLGLADEAHEAAEVGARREQDGSGGRAVAAGAAGLLVVGLEAADGSAQCQTERTSALSTPIPKALVATTTSASPRMNASCARVRWSARQAGVVGGRLSLRR